MQIIRTESFDPTDLIETEKLYIYNGLDCCVTYEVLEKLLTQLRPDTQRIYDFSRELQGPILEINTRGIRVDIERRDRLLTTYREESLRLAEQLNHILREGVGFQFEIGKTRKNFWPSDQQLCDLFYNHMGLPGIFKLNDDGERRLTVDRKALERLESYFYAEPLVRHLYVLREHAKKISFLSTEVDADERFRTSLGIARTRTGRLSSILSDMGTGSNIQNIENRLRAIFVPDPGYKFCNIDLEQSDSRVCGAIQWNLFRDNRYLDLCESGDLHTGVARIAFRNLPWTDDPAANRAIANNNFYRHFSYRDATKRLGHGTNFQGEPPKMSRETHIPIADIERFQAAYLPAFRFREWWEWVEGQVRGPGRITTLAGRPRRFFGHPKDPATIREAIAYEPQEVTANTSLQGLLNIWKANRVQLLAQVHDSVLFQFPEEQEDEIVPWALEQCRILYHLKGDRDFIIPSEAKTGYNWSDDKNDPDALQKWYPGKTRSKRERL